MRNPRRGFTLIEILIVIAIIAILVAVLFPIVLGAQARAYDSTAGACARQIAAGQEVSFIDSMTYVASYADLTVAAPGVTDNCEATWVTDSTDFTTGWFVQHPRGSGMSYQVGPGGIIPPP